MKNQVQEINEPEFEQEVLRCAQPVLVGFLAAWSKPSRLVEPVLDEVARACNGNAKIVKVNVDDNPDLGTIYAIQSVPTLIYFFNGAVRAKIVGMVSPKAIPPDCSRSRRQPLRRMILNRRVADKNTNSESKMKIDFHSEPGKSERLMISLGEFSFAAYPVQINHVFRCLPDAASSPNQSRNQRQNVLSRRISQMLRWACGKPAAAPAAGNLSPEQAVP